MTASAEKHLRLAFLSLRSSSAFPEEVAYALSEEWLRSFEANPPKTAADLRRFVETAVRGALIHLSKDIV